MVAPRKINLHVHPIRSEPPPAKALESREGLTLSHTSTCVLPIFRYLSGMREQAGWGVLLAAAMQVNDAMCLFEEHELLHRDLAARNVLVFSFHPRDRSKVLVKLCDYGLVIDESDVARRERAAGGGEEGEEEEEDIPWRYIPPEAMAYRAWSHKSDVWSFGISIPPYPDYRTHTLACEPMRMYARRKGCWSAGS